MSVSKEKVMEARLAFANAQALAPHLKDSSKAEWFLKTQLSNARKTALLLGSILVITLVTAVYAYVQGLVAKEARQKSNALEQLAIQSMETLQSQQAHAQISLMAAQEALDQAKAELEKCKSKK